MRILLWNGVWVIFFVWGIGRLLIDEVAWGSCVEIRDYFENKVSYNSQKITALCNCNCSAVLTYIQTHTSSCLLKTGNGRHTHIPIPTLDLACTNTHLGARLLLPLSLSLPLNTQASSYLLEIGWWWQTYTHSYPRLIAAQTHILPLRLQERFPYMRASLRATCVLISPVWGEYS